MLTGPKVTSASTCEADNNQICSVNVYPLEHRSSDPRPYVEVSILGHRVLGLLDSGACKSVIGMDGLSLFERLGLCLCEEGEGSKWG